VRLIFIREISTEAVRRIFSGLAIEADIALVMLGAKKNS
jgi:hypothetical protein